MNYYKLIILCFYILISFSFENSDYDLLLQWGKNNSMKISDKIQIEFINENNKTFFAQDNIIKGEEILNIPNSILLNIENTLKLYGKQANKLYSELKSKLNSTSNFNIEQSFIAYIMYKVNKNKKHKKNKFYNHYQYLFNTYETNFDSFPLFYSIEQKNLLRSTSLSFLINKMNRIFDEEIEFYEKELKQKKINKEDYYVFRTYSQSKSFNISGHSVIIPFLDMFNKHPTKFNTEVIASDYNVRVIATKDIYPGDKLFIKSNTLTNHNALMYFGITFEEIIERVENYYIPILNPSLIKNHNIDLDADSSLAEYFTNYMEIKSNNNEFYLKYIEVYKKLAKKFELEEDELSAYNLILENMLTIKELNNQINPYIYKIFYQQKDINNILTILKTENRFLDEKIDLMKYLVNKIVRENEENKIEDINLDLDL